MRTPPCTGLGASDSLLNQRLLPMEKLQTNVSYGLSEANYQSIERGKLRAEQLVGELCETSPRHLCLGVQCRHVGNEYADIMSLVRSPQATKVQTQVASSNAHNMQRSLISPSLVYDGKERNARTCHNVVMFALSADPFRWIQVPHHGQTRSLTKSPGDVRLKRLPARSMGKRSLLL